MGLGNNFSRQEKQVLHTVMVVLVALFVIMCSIVADAAPIVSSQTVRSVAAQIHKARGMQLKTDHKLATLIVKVSTQYNINPNVYTAILAHESMFKLNAVNHKSHDYGIAQINIRNIRNMGLDLDLVLTDLEYSLRAGAQVLSYMQSRFAASESNYMCRFNVGTARVLSVSQSTICNRYMGKLKKYYAVNE